MTYAMHALFLVACFLTVHGNISSELDAMKRLQVIGDAVPLSKVNMSQRLNNKCG
jgi:hypothetical protein